MDLVPNALWAVFGGAVVSSIANSPLLKKKRKNATIEEEPQRIWHQQNPRNQNQQQDNDKQEEAQRIWHEQNQRNQNQQQDNDIDVEQKWDNRRDYRVQEDRNSF